MPSIDTHHGVTVTLTPKGKITLDHPDAPGDMRNIEAGRVTYDGQGFQPVGIFPGAMRPDVLRAIADLIDHNQKGL